MTLRVGFQMDPIENIDIRGDSTFALLLEAQARGHEIFYYTPDNLSIQDGRVLANGQTLSVQDEPGAHFKVKNPRREDLSDLDAVFLRQDPPFDMNYITTTHILERIHPGTLVVNDPAHVRNAPEKLFVLDFKELMPPTMITRQLDDVKAFRKEYKDIIVKPLYGNGGAGVFRIAPGDTNLGALIELFQSIFPESFMVQQYLPAVREGDKRIILVDGEVAGAINRLPPAGETRSNLHVGGQPASMKLTKRDRQICEALGPALKERGLIFTGIDVIGDHLTEINVTSPTGIREIARFDGVHIAPMIMDAVEARVADFKQKEKCDERV